MATAIEPSSQPRTPTPPAKLAVASLLGAVYVVMALAVVFYAVPHLWGQYVAPQIGTGLSFVSVALKLVVQLSAVVGLAIFGRSLVGGNPPRGLRGGIFLMIVAALLIFFVARAVGMSFEGSAAQIGFAAVAVALLVVAFRLFTSPRGERWMVGLEEQGWFHSNRYKPALGQRVRRLTILGLLAVGATGVWSIKSAGTLPADWTLTLPFTDQPITVLADLEYSVPLILLALTLWVAFRAVNLPTFAEFLIATEAEMNKVSWTSRKRLVQDTLVVLITTFLMTLFLLVVDLFWGWLLSQPWIGVLPAKATAQDKGGQVREAKW